MAIRSIFFLILALQFPLAIQAGEGMQNRSRAKPMLAPSSDTREQKPPLPPRRRVPAIIPPTIPPASSSAPPQMPRPPATLPPPTVRPSQADQPATVAGCDPAGCWDGSGNRYNSGNGTTYLNNAGKLCTRNGLWMQCF